MLNLIKENELFNSVRYVTLQGNRTIEERMESIKLFETNNLPFPINKEIILTTLTGTNAQIKEKQSPKKELEYLQTLSNDDKIFKNQKYKIFLIFNLSLEV